MDHGDDERGAGRGALDGVEQAPLVLWLGGGVDQRRAAGLPDEAIDTLFVRPAFAVGRWANSVFERYVVQGLVVAAVDLVRGASAGVRGVQSGYLRSYALLLVTGFAGLGLYFLLQS